MGLSSVPSQLQANLISSTTHNTLQPDAQRAVSVASTARGLHSTTSSMPVAKAQRFWTQGRRRMSNIREWANKPLLASPSHPTEVPKSSISRRDHEDATHPSKLSTTLSRPKSTNFATARYFLTSVPLAATPHPEELTAAGGSINRRKISQIPLQATVPDCRRQLKEPGITAILRFRNNQVGGLLGPKDMAGILNSGFPTPNPGPGLITSGHLGSLVISTKQPFDSFRSIRSGQSHGSPSNRQTDAKDPSESPRQTVEAQVGVTHVSARESPSTLSMSRLAQLERHTGSGLKEALNKKLRESKETLEKEKAQMQEEFKTKMEQERAVIKAELQAAPPPNGGRPESTFTDPDRRHAWRRQCTAVLPNFKEAQAQDLLSANPTVKAIRTRGSRTISKPCPATPSKVDQNQPPQAPIVATPRGGNVELSNLTDAQACGLLSTNLMVKAILAHDIREVDQEPQKFLHKVEAAVKVESSRRSSQPSRRSL
ncbi:hypothetical protein CONLIGDRAFT_699873 [Coniochaeta ligniaria NRRL 30616]|uniref:Uncharacterized protein n=1 Tax=Coniochaeta ligniaria NRRL 30616 TaxID=1408157 RepID=A0A1J7JM87_9PEZI|nr:hypothetical protein CONLIGDRAFT_699873 [Coniochaeta ligniaria NRRL 30616]